MKKPSSKKGQSLSSQVTVVESNPLAEEIDSDWNSRVAILAHEIWVSRGRPDGTHEEDWYEAERQLRAAGDAPAREDSDQSEDSPSSL